MEARHTPYVCQLATEVFKTTIKTNLPLSHLHFGTSEVQSKPG